MKVKGIAIIINGGAKKHNGKIPIHNRPNSFTNCSKLRGLDKSKFIISLLNLFIILPTGVVSNHLIGHSNTASNISLCKRSLFFKKKSFTVIIKNATPNAYKMAIII